MKKEKNVTYQIAILAFLFVISSVMVTSAPFQMLSDVNPKFFNTLTISSINAEEESGVGGDDGGKENFAEKFNQEAEGEDVDQSSDQGSDQFSFAGDDSDQSSDQ